MAKVADGDTENNELLTTFLNDSIRAVCNIRGGKWPFLEVERGLTVQANVGTYRIYSSLRKINDVAISVGNTIYRPRPVYNSEDWNNIKMSNITNSDITLYYYVQDGNINFYPKFATTTPFVIFTGRYNQPDMGIADVSQTLSISITNGQTTLTSSTSVFNASMVGKFIKISSTSAVNGGDNRWYKISSYTSGTTLSIGSMYEGTTIASGSNVVTIGEMSPIPEAYDMAPIYRTMALYTQINDPLHSQISTQYWRLYDGGQEAGLSNGVGGLIGQMLENEGSVVEDVYLSPYDDINTSPNTPPRYPITGV